MNTDSIMLDMLSRERICIEAKPIDKDLIEEIFNQVIESIEAHNIIDIDIVLILCNSYNKYSSIKSTKSRNGEKSYLLYDMHLQEINNRLNAVYLGRKDPGHDDWKLSYDLFAEEAILSQEDVLTTYFTLNEVALGEYEIRAEKLKEAKFWEAVQIRYVIAHEIGHWIYRVYKEKGEMDEWKEIKNVLDDVKTILIDVYEWFKNRYLDEAYQQVINEQRKIVDESDDIVEECFADAIAYASVMGYMSCTNEQKNRKIQAGKALFVTMMNLQILAMHHMSVSTQSFEDNTSIRIAFFRQYLGLYFDDCKESFERMLESSVNRYEKRITNIMLDSFAELVKRSQNIREYETVMNYKNDTFFDEDG